MEFGDRDDDRGNTVRTAPRPLRRAFAAQRVPRSRRQCSTMPVWAIVKPTNTPIAKSGTRVLVSPPEKTSKAAETTASPTTPVPVHLPVGLETEDVRQVIVPGEQFEQDGQATEGGVGGEREQHHGGELDDVEGPVVPQGGVGELGEDGNAFHRLESEAGDQYGQADQHHAEQRAERDLRAHRPAGRWGTERRHCVRDRLDPGESRAARGERLQQEQGAHGGGVVGEDGGVTGGGGCGDGSVTEQADDDQEQDRADEDGGRGDEGAGRVDDAPHVHGRDEHEDAETEHQPVVVEAGKAEVRAATPAVTATATLRT